MYHIKIMLIFVLISNYNNEVSKTLLDKFIKKEDAFEHSKSKRKIRKSKEECFNGFSGQK